MRTSPTRHFFVGAALVGNLPVDEDLLETARLPRNACTRLWEELLALYLHSKTALIRQICGECLMCRANDNNDGCCHKDDKRQQSPGVVWQQEHV